MTVISIPSFAKGVISPNIYGRVDVPMYKVALRTGRNAIIHSYGGVSNRPGSLCIGPCKSHSSSLIPRIFRFHQGTTDQYVLEVGDLYIRVVRNDAYVLNSATTITAATQTDPVVVTAGAHGLSAGADVVITMAAGMVELNSRRFILRNVTTNTFELEDQITGVSVDGTGYTAYTTGGTVADVFELTTPYVQADLSTLKMVQTGNTITVTHVNYAPRDLVRTDHNAWTLSVNSYAPGIAAVTNIGGIASEDTNFQVFESFNQTVLYQVTAISDVDGRFEESLPLTLTFTNSSDPPLNTITWDAVAAADRYAVYRRDNGLYGLLGETELTTFEDKNLATDLTISPPQARNPFSSLFPMASGYYEQRQVYGGTVPEPDKSWYSQTGLRLNMSVSSPLQPADAITASLASQDVQEIRHYVPVGGDLMIMTNAGEWRVNSGPDSGFSADTIKQKPETNWGSSHDVPIIIGKTILFVEDGSARVRALGFKLAIDGFDTNDLTILANHFLAEKSADEFIITDWSFAQFPEPRIYMVRSDGKALTMTFDAEQEVIAWTIWDTRGKYKSTTSLRRSVNGVEDGVYFIVQRKTSLGGDMNILERMHSRKFSDVRNGFFLDMGHKIDNKIDITDITDADPAVFTADAHGFSDGDEVEIVDIEWFKDIVDECSDDTPNQFNDLRFTIANKTDNTFELLDQSVTGDSEGWDVTEEVCDESTQINVTAEVLVTRGVALNPAGMVMFVADGNPNTIFQYNLSVAHDITSAVYSGNSFTPGAELLNNIMSIFMKPDGTELYLGLANSFNCKQYNLASGWDLSSTITFNAGTTGNTFNGERGPLCWNADGTKVYYNQYVLGHEIVEYAVPLANAWDASAALSPATARMATDGFSTNGRDIQWRTDGSRFYILNVLTDHLVEFTVGAGTAFSIAALTPTGNEVDLTDCTIKTTNFHWSDDGINLYIGAQSPDRVFQVQFTAQSVTEDIGKPSTEIYNRGGEVRLCISILPDMHCLEGINATLFLDGNVEPSQTVVNGAITVADGRCVTRAFAGLPYTCDIELLDIEVGTKPQTLQGKLKKISKVTVRFWKSRMPQVGPRSNYLTQMRPREFEKLGQASQLISGDAVVNLPPDWNSNGRIFFRQCDPVPLTILAVFPDLTAEDELE